MKSLVFRPLRRMRKTGKVCVASYSSWRKVSVADYSQFNLIVDNEYAGMPLGEYVYDHDGNQLFWNNFDPNSVPIYYSAVTSLIEGAEPDYSFAAFSHNPTTRLHYCVRHLDCDGVPTFSHLTADCVATHYENMNDSEPLTVAIVVKWVGWFFYQLQNSNLQIGK